MTCMIGTGTLVDGKYAITRAIGAGGFGAVYEAKQVQFDRKVAIKVISTNLLMEADGPGRFEREAKTLDLLRHKNIVGCYGYGVWDGAPYMVMEYVDGIPLEKVIAINGAMEYTRALNILRQVLEGLSSAHTAGIVHRDLKPSNIMITQDADGKDAVKIIDFGLVKLLPGYGIPAQKLTETGCAVGSCMYMAPEQALGEEIDERVDIYATGAILYHMLTGKPPFEGDVNVAIMFQHLNAVPDAIAKYLPQSAPANALGVVVDNCMAKDRATRYGSCGEVIKDIDFILNGELSKVSALATRQMKALNPPPNKNNRAMLAAIVATAIITAGITMAGVQHFAPGASKMSTLDPVSQADSALLRKLARVGFDHRQLDKSELEAIEKRELRSEKLNPYDRFLLSVALAKYYERLLKSKGIDMWTFRRKTHEYANSALHLLPYVPDSEEALCVHALAEIFSESGYDEKQREVLTWMTERNTPRVRYNGDCMLASYELHVSKTQDSASFQRAVALNEEALRLPVADSHTAKLIKAHIDYLRGNLDAAAAVYDEISHNDDQMTCACGLARVALAKGDYAVALEYARRAQTIASKDGDHLAAAELLVAAALKASGGDKAAAEAREIIESVEKKSATYLPEVGILRSIDSRLAAESHKGFVPKVVPL